MGHWEVRRGDLVCLKAGGPIMTVRKVRSNWGTPVAECSWVEDDATRNKAFTTDFLEHITHSEIGVALTFLRKRRGLGMDLSGILSFLSGKYR
jgi:uncharacterized protein YodC (DUF2158 family)